MRRISWYARLEDISENRRSIQELRTHFLPRQFLGPKENGWNTNFWSSLNRSALGSQRLGKNFIGSMKFLDEG